MSLNKTNIRYAPAILFVITFVGWVGVEALGPILCNIGNDFGITDMVKIICRASFYTTLIMLILSIFWRKTYLAAIITSTIYGAFAYANLLYFRSFNQYFPLNLLTEFQQLEGLGASIFSLIRWADILFIFATIIPIITYRYLRPYIHNFSIRNHLIALLAICFMTAIPSIGTSKLLHIGELHKSVNWIIACEPTRAYKVYGLMPIIAYQTTNTNNKSLILNDDERDVIACQIKEKCADFLNMQPYSIYQKQNLVLMLMESLNTSCIMPDVMPTLSSLCSQATTLYCPQVTQMTQGAMSIGGQLTVLSGLNGLRTSVFTTDYPHNTYPSIASELNKKYTSLYSYTVVGTSSNYWRQDNVNLSLGIANLFDKQDIQALTGNSYSGALDWAGDKDIFNFAGQKLPSNKKPFFAVAISTDMHAPYTYDATIDCNITFENITDPALHEYMRRARYADEQLTSFIQALKDKGLYDDTLIVVTSDHQVPSAYCSDAMRKYLSPYIPAIFINTGADWTEQNERNKDVVFCHSQVYPTMLQLMGLRPEKYAGLFPPMTNIEATQEYDFANCAYETTTDKRIKQIYDIEEKIIRSSYFGVME